MNQNEINLAIKNFIADTPLNFSQDGSYKYFDEPLVGFADVNDKIFLEIRDAISPEYFLPTDWLKIAGDSRKNLSGTVISWILPLSKKVRDSNKEKIFPSEEWAHARFFGEKCNQALRAEIVKIFHEKNIFAIAPSDHQKWKRIFSEKRGHASNWSERHAAYAAGLGTFSLSDGLITERGVAHRTGSVIAAVNFSPTERKYFGIYDNCLHFRSGKCGACIARCPAHAITRENGHDKNICFDYTRNKVMPNVNEGYGVTTPSCGKCQTRVPCEIRIP